jgi:hypothetical protein
MIQEWQACVIIHWKSWTAVIVVYLQGLYAARTKVVGNVTTKHADFAKLMTVRRSWEGVALINRVLPA